MVIEGIDYHQDIINAIRDNTLVVFAGAGVSMGNPTNLPNFTQLARDITVGISEHLEEEGKEDKFLGTIERKYKADLKESAAQRVGGEDLCPNKMHAAILGLFKDKSNIKIVTTNYDVMFERQYKTIFKADVMSYSAPAIPLGNDIDGIIHLHGSISMPKNMILTDTDFGNAYLLNGYATRFIVDLFKTYTVLFIGYSYNDLIVRYLTSAIPSKDMKHCYILTDSTIGDDDWKSLDLNPIYFPEKNYEAEYTSLISLGIRGKRGVFEWETTLKLNYTDNPPEDIEKIDELQDALNEEPFARKLLENISSESWMEWLDSKHYFNNLFTPGVSLINIDNDFAYWLINHQKNTGIFYLYRLHGSNINSNFVNDIILSFDENPVDNELFEKYITLFLPYIKESYVIYNLLNNILNRKMYAQLWRVFALLLNYKVELIKGFNIFENNATSVKIHFVGKDLLQSCWQKVEPYTECFADEGFEQTIVLLNNVYADLKHFDKLSSDEIFSWEYANIEHNNINSINEERIVFSDIICACYSQLHNQKNIKQIIENHLNSDCWIVKKILLKAFRCDTNISANDKMQMLLDYFDLYDLRCKEQIFKMAAEVFDKSDKEKQIQFINTLINRQIIEDNSKRKVTLYEVYNWFVWLHGYSHNPLIEKEFLELTNNHPEFSPRDNPEVSISFSDGNITDESPISPEQIRNMRYGLLLNDYKKYTEQNFHDGFTKYGYLNAILETVKTNYQWAFNFAKYLIRNKYYEKDIWNNLIYGISKFCDDNLKIKDFMQLLNHKKIIEKYASSISSLMFSFVNSNKTACKDAEDRKWIFNISKKLLNYIGDDANQTILKLEDRFLNTIGGNVAFVFMYLIQDGYTDADFLHKCEALIEKQIFADQISQEFLGVIVSNFGFLFSIDIKWAEEYIAPLLMSDNNEIFLSSWTGFLILSHQYSVSEAQMLLPYFDGCTKKDEFNSFPNDIRYLFIKKYSTFIISCSNDPIKEYLPSLTPVCKTNEDKSIFLSEVTRHLKALRKDERNSIWNLWIKHYLQLRTQRIYGSISNLEVSEILNWVAYSDGFYSELVSLILKFEDINELKNIGFLKELIKSNIVEENINDTLDLVEFTVKKSEYPSAYKNEIKQIINIAKNNKIYLRKIELVEETCYEKMVEI